MVVAFVAVMCGGCGRANMDPEFVNHGRAEQGLVVILPGIEGESSLNRDIRRGLRDGGVPYALMIYRWGSYVPGFGMLINQMDVPGNRRSAAELAGAIVEYQKKWPGRPVFIIGHSAGGGIAVFALEALGNNPQAEPIEGALLLSASISADYDLTDALRMTRRGVANVCNHDDHILTEGTAIFGNVDGGRGPSAGRTGFTREYPRLYQALHNGRTDQTRYGRRRPAAYGDRQSRADCQVRPGLDYERPMAAAGSGPGLPGEPGPIRRRHFRGTRLEPHDRPDQAAQEVHGNILIGRELGDVAVGMVGGDDELAAV